MQQQIFLRSTGLRFQILPPAQLAIYPALIASKVCEAISSASVSMLLPIEEVSLKPSPAAMAWPTNGIHLEIPLPAKLMPALFSNNKMASLPMYFEVNCMALATMSFDLLSPSSDEL